MVTKELKSEIISGKHDDDMSPENVTAIKESDMRELEESFAPFSEKIARGATSHSAACSERKEVSRKVAETCRAIMQRARRDNVAPTERIDEGCKAAGIPVSDLMDELDKL